MIDPAIRSAILVGFLGGFTTFSSFAFENMRMISGSMFSMSLLYILSSNILGITLVFVGYFLGLKMK